MVRSLKVSVGRRVKAGKLEDVHDSLHILSNASHRKGVIDSRFIQIPIL
jgi:hypothetical protein